MYNMNDMNDNYDEFDKYAMTYDMDESMIAYKYNHSYRVMHECDEIAFTLKFEEDDTYLACLIGLLHDIGRFEQWKQYKTFDDSKSIDHADYASELLFKDNLIEKFKLNKKDYDLVNKAIKNHNKLAINEEEMNEREILFSKIIRDADKLDILYAFSNPRLLEIKEDEDKEISEKVKTSFYNHEPVRKVDVKNNNDRVIVFLSFIYDLYFDYSKYSILEKKYFEKMLEYLKNKELFKPYFDEAINYLKGSVKNVR